MKHARTILASGILAAGLVALGLSVAPAHAAEDLSEALHPKAERWPQDNPFGMYDKAELQRGYQVYKEVCAACHGLSRVSFHDLSAEGGPGFSAAEAKAIAASFQVPAEANEKGETYNASGERIKRPGITADKFPSPFENEAAARTANNGAAPPDLSIMTKAREHGPQYVYSVLTGFHQTPPAGFKVVDGKYYNPYFPGRNISMPPPLSANQVTYADGTKATVEQEAHDVVAFLSWAAEPKMEQRKRMGVGVMAFLLVLSGLLFLSYRRIWHGHHDVGA